MREMKDSGIEWIKNIPCEWAVMHNKYVMHKIKDIVPVYSGEDILSLTMNGVIIRDLDAGGKMPTTFDGYQKLYPNNLLMCLFDIDVTPRCVGLIKNNGVSSPAYSQFVLNKFAHATYYNYYYVMLDNDKTLLHLAKNLRHSLTEDLLGAVSVIVPPLPEQQSIAAYLDTKCAEIDSLISDIQKQIETLEEYKRSVITEAVDNDALHFTETRLGYEAWIRARLGWKGLKADEYIDDGHPFLSAFNIINQKLSWNNLNFITDDRYNESPEIKLKVGDIVLVKDGAGVGKCARIDEMPFLTATTNSSLAVISTNDSLNYRFLYYILLSSVFQSVIFQVVNGMGVPHLTQEELRKIKIRIPSIKEQQQIADYLDEKCAEIDSIILNKKKQLETLEEYKKSLIYEYVTGKKEVPSQAVMIDPRIILAGTILNRLGANLKGKIQVQKIMYLCETMLDLPFQTQYFRYQHGPYDKNIDTYLAELNSNQWFVIQDKSPMTCRKGNKFSDFENEHLSEFSDYNDEIEKIVSFIAPMKTSQAERIATLFAVWNDFIIDGIMTPSDDQIINEVVTKWTPNKANSEKKTWKGTLDKMKKNGITPKGFGKHTQPKDI